MKSAIMAGVVVAAAATPPPNKEMLFEEFVKKYDKHYDSEFDKGFRFRIFSENVDQIYASNAKNKSYTLGVTKNADLTFNEWKANHLTGGFKPTLTAQKDRPRFYAPKDFIEPADGVDWVAKGGVTSVKNQGTCGSCWTFSTVGALEGAMFVAKGKLEDLSMQQILACDTGGSGCKGGQMDQAFDWVKQNGLPSLTDVPYLCKDADSTACQNMQCGACTRETGEHCILSDSCKLGTCNHDSWLHKCMCEENECFSDGKCQAKEDAPLVINVGDVTGHTDVDNDGSGKALEAAVAQQPVSVAIEADQSVFQHYTGGVLTNDACGSTLDHGVLAVGYGTDNGQKYWKVKNSWGTTFGEDGYIRIERGDPSDGGECGIRKMASYPEMKKASTVVV